MPQVIPWEVKYSKNRPIVSLTDHKEQDWEKALLTKSEHWKYEDEYRALTPDYLGITTT